jgi:acyl-coenzyme A thioesterase PaaI-like protein
MSVDDTEAAQLAQSIRELIEQMMTIEAPAAGTAAAAKAVRTATEELRAAGGSPRLPLTQAPEGDVAAFFRFSPVSGESNPLAPPVHLQVGEDAVTGTCTFGNAYEGPPGYVHGAFVAAVFDELLGVTNAALGLPAMTGLLEVRFHQPTPLGIELTLEGRHTGTSGRKSHASGEIRVGDTVLAEAKGTFVAVTPGKAIELFGKLLEQIQEDDPRSTGTGPRSRSTE